MSKDQIDDWALESGLDLCPGWVMSGKARENLERFAKRVAAQAAAEEREQCAKVCDELSCSAAKDWKARYDPHDSGRELGADECAAAIRERKSP